MINPYSGREKRVKKVSEKFGGKEKRSYICGPVWNEGGWDRESWRKKGQKNLKKVLRIKKKFLPLQPRLRKGLEKRAGRLQVQKEIIEKTEGKYKEASTKNKMNESVSFF